VLGIEGTGERDRSHFIPFQKTLETFFSLFLNPSYKCIKPSSFCQPDHSYIMGIRKPLIVKRFLSSTFVSDNMYYDNFRETMGFNP